MWREVYLVFELDSENVVGVFLAPPHSSLKAARRAVKGRISGVYGEAMNSTWNGDRENGVWQYVDNGLVFEIQRHVIDG